MEITPENALLLSMLIRDGVNGKQNIKKQLSNTSKEDLMSIGQKIIDQIIFKTDFDSLGLKNDLLGGIEQN
ncbi:hypothetical protein [Emticicia sp. SJ17W-69]|uniref:hypothetical protein n=1 Tax=Emticicia sp. SJ17W-69 TaxID=3421657 RepID=UPI003EC0E80B